MTSAAIAFITFIVGTIIGYLANRFLSPSANAEKQLVEQINQSESALSQYKQDVAEHLEQSADLLTQMNKTCQSAMLQMEQSTQLLKQATPVEASSMPFFSAETQQQLAETAAKRHPKRQLTKPETTSQPPLDYSDEPSGLFGDQKQSVTNTDG
jgi:uncharacterized protein